MYEHDSSDDRQPQSERPHAATPLEGAEARFASCRWRKPEEGTQPAHCTHREVLPMAGSHGFSPESWCPECQFYKLRRVPRRDSFTNR